MKSTYKRFWNSWCAPQCEETPMYWTPPTPSKDDPTRYELGTHFNMWTACGIVVVALVICYFTESYPWINGVFKP